MKRLPALTVLMVALAHAWSSPQIYNVCHSAAPANGAVYVNADIWDVPRDDMTVTLWYSIDNQATWQFEPMRLVGGPGYDSTFQAGFVAPGSGNAYYYVRATNGTNFGTEGPYNSGDVWPVTDNWLAEFSIEATGDTFNDPRGEYLDLTSAAFGRSGDRFYGRLTNHHNSWPLNAGVLGPWFLYSVGFANADAPSDSWGYSMTHANVLGIYRSGLYELNKYTASFEKVGDIEVQTAGNRLVMRCRISDLTARPHWGPWPSSSGFLSSMRGETRSANASLESWQHDTTFPARYYVDKTPVVRVGQNQPPVLSNGRVTPTAGEPGTNFWFAVRYTDADTNLPVVRAVIVDGETLTLAASVHRYREAVLFDLRRSYSDIGWHRFHFVFGDGMTVVTTAEDSFQVVGTGLAEDRPHSSAALAAFPNPFAGRVRFQMSRIGSALQVFDGRGSMVRRLFVIKPGQRFIDWDGRDLCGRVLPDGVYFCREEGGPLRRLLLVKLAPR